MTQTAPPTLGVYVNEANSGFTDGFVVTPSLVVLLQMKHFETTSLNDL